MARPVRSYLLCEDVGQELFFRPILDRLLGRRTVVWPKPRLKGGHTFVKDNLPHVAKLVRRKASEALALVVVVDADSMGFKARLEEIRTKGNLTGATWERHVALCIPSRNIETWVLWLNGEQELDERTDYSKRVKNQRGGAADSIREASQAWFDRDTGRRAIEETRLPALTHARAEIDRLSQLAKS